MWLTVFDVTIVRHFPSSGAAVFLASITMGATAVRQSYGCFSNVAPPATVAVSAADAAHLLCLLLLLMLLMPMQMVVERGPTSMQFVEQPWRLGQHNCKSTSQPCRLLPPAAACCLLL